MIQWVESKDGKWYWCQQFPKGEKKLLKKYRITMGRMTKLDYSGFIK